MYAPCECTSASTESTSVTAASTTTETPSVSTTSTTETPSVSTTETTATSATRRACISSDMAQYQYYKTNCHQSTLHRLVMILFLEYRMTSTCNPQRATVMTHTYAKNERRSPVTVDSKAKAQTWKTAVIRLIMQSVTKPSLIQCCWLDKRKGIYWEEHPFCKKTLLRKSHRFTFTSLRQTWTNSDIGY